MPNRELKLYLPGEANVSSHVPTHTGGQRLPTTVVLKCASGPPASGSPGDLLGMQILRAPLRLAESETLGVGNVGFHQPSRLPRCSLEFGNYWSEGLCWIKF